MTKTHCKHFPKLFNRFIVNVKIGIDLPSYATKTDEKSNSC